MYKKFNAGFFFRLVSSESKLRTRHGPQVVATKCIDKHFVLDVRANLQAIDFMIYNNFNYHYEHNARCRLRCLQSHGRQSWLFIFMEACCSRSPKIAILFDVCNNFPFNEINFLCFP